MGNVELRWVLRSALGLTFEKVLQYRQKVDTTIRAGMFNDAAPNFEWSRWQDVPTITE